MPMNIDGTVATEHDTGVSTYLFAPPWRAAFLALGAFHPKDPLRVAVVQSIYGWFTQLRTDDFELNIHGAGGHDAQYGRHNAAAAVRAVATALIKAAEQIEADPWEPSGDARG